MDAQPTSLLTRMSEDIKTIDDPRASNARHFLTDILVIAILAVMAGVDDYPGIVEFHGDSPRFRHLQSAHVITANPRVRLPGPARAWGGFDGRAEARDPRGRVLC